MLARPKRKRRRPTRTVVGIDAGTDPPGVVVVQVHGTPLDAANGVWALCQQLDRLANMATRASYPRQERP